MTKVKYGDTIRVHYTGRLEGGQVFDSTRERDPVQLTVGETTLMPALEVALIGMSAGERRTVRVPAEREFDPQRKAGSLIIGRDEMPPDTQLEVGQQVELRHENGRATVIKVVSVSDSEAVLEAHHYVAEKELTFELEIADIL